MNAHHYDEELRADHAARYRMQTRIIVKNRMRIRSLSSLKDQIRLILDEIEVNRRAGQRPTATDPERLLAANLTDERLLTLESVIRDWVKNHPEKP